MRFVIFCILLFCFVAVAVPSVAGGQREAVDKIAVVVGDRIILSSEIAAQVQMIFLQSGRTPRVQSEVDSIRNQVIDQMISDQLFLVAARDDTTISVRDEEVEMALDDHVARVAQNFDTEEKFLQALEQEGLTLREFRRRYHDEVSNQILKQRYIQRKLSSVSISRREVEDFYTRFKDSIPTQPEAVKLAHILVAIEVSPQAEDSVKARVADLRLQVLDGADFASVSAQNSGMGAAAGGGDLGWVSQDDLTEEMSRSAYNLKIGDVSGVIRSVLGYHVFKCEDRRADQMKLRHIFLPVHPTTADTAIARNLIDSLIREAEGGKDFRELAKIFSADNGTRAIGGELGWFAVDQLPFEFADAVAGWRTPGEYRGPIESADGFHILKLLDHRASKQLTIADDFDQIKQMARQDKTARQVDKWIGELKDQTYVDIRMVSDES